MGTVEKEVRKSHTNRYLGRAFQTAASVGTKASGQEQAAFGGE